MAEWTLQQLVELYARNSPQDIPNLPAYRALCQEFVGNSGFQAARQRVEKAAVIVQETMESSGGQAEEVVCALRLLRRTRSVPKDLELYHSLLYFGYYDSWSTERRAHFDVAFANLRLPYDFFFSFTNRYEQPDGENPVNSAYKHFILRVLTPDEWRAADRKKENLLARAIYRLLCRSQGHVGFFFPDTQYDNEVTEEKLRRDLEGSFVFIQLVQNVMFRPLGAKTNYCHWEYSITLNRLTTDGDHKHRILFALAEKGRDAFLPANRVHPDYDRWHRDVLQRDPPYLPEADEPRQAHSRFRQIRTLIEEKLVEKIEQAWDREIENVS